MSCATALLEADIQRWGGTIEDRLASYPAVIYLRSLVTPPAAMDAKGPGSPAKATVFGVTFGLPVVVGAMTVVYHYTPKVFGV